MALIVQKFGGTSVATQESRCLVMNKIMKAKNRADQVVVVVSAIGRLGSPYATDTLINLATNLKPREKDLLLSCGEVISATVLSSLLNENGYNTRVLTGGQAGIITNETYFDADIIDVKTDRVIELLNSDIIPIITGFQGISEDGNVTTIGRGGSDTSAALIGESIEADAIEIYTDVNGIMTADPRVYDKAKVIDFISYEEVFQLADSGAKVIHPRAVEIARRCEIPLYIKNTFSDEIGTVISKNKNFKVKKSEITNTKVITSIAHINNRVQFSIIGEDINDENVFNELANNDVSIDIINIFIDRRVFTVDERHFNTVKNILNAHELDIKFIKNCSKVTLIGERMTGIPGVMARIISSLKKENIKIFQTADSLTTIACLVKSEDLERTVRNLHEEFEI